VFSEIVFSKIHGMNIEHEHRMGEWTWAPGKMHLQCCKLRF